MYFFSNCCNPGGWNGGTEKGNSKRLRLGCQHKEHLSDREWFQWKVRIWKWKPTGDRRKNWKSLARYQVHPAHIVSSWAGVDILILFSPWRSCWCSADFSTSSWHSWNSRQKLIRIFSECVASIKFNSISWQLTFWIQLKHLRRAKRAPASEIW